MVEACSNEEIYTLMPDLATFYKPQYDGFRQHICPNAECKYSYPAIEYCGEPDCE